MGKITDLGAGLLRKKRIWAVARQDTDGMCTEPTEEEYKPVADAKTGRPGQSNEMSLKTDVMRQHPV